MKSVAIGLSLFLAGILLLCPVLLCPARADAADFCCHHHPTHSLPDCPYTILSKSKARPNAAQALTAVITLAAGFGLPPVSTSYFLVNESRLINSTGLYLRNRVLLI